MKFSLFITAVVSTLSSVVASPLAQSYHTPLSQSFPSNSVSSTDPSDVAPYIVLFNSSYPDFPEVTEVLERVGLDLEHTDVHVVYNGSALRGFCANMAPQYVTALEAMPDVAVVEKSRAISIQAIQSRPGATWGLQRISSSATVTTGNPNGLNFTYSFNGPASPGTGVDIYHLDTGINTEHVAFGGRAQMIWPNSTQDDNGHGSHTAGTAAANVFGVASGANILGFKTLDENGIGVMHDTIAAIDFAISRHTNQMQQPGFTGSVMSMSFSLTRDSSTAALQLSIDAAIDAGMHVAVAAGNNGNNSCNYAPAYIGGNNGRAISVGSISMENTISTFSNTGACVDLYAPGEEVLSTWMGGVNMINADSGTSMATPHVTGVIAYLIGGNETLANDPVELKKVLLGMAIRGQITGQTYPGGNMLMVSNGITAVS